MGFLRHLKIDGIFRATNLLDSYLFSFSSPIGLLFQVLGQIYASVQCLLTQLISKTVLLEHRCSDQIIKEGLKLRRNLSVCGSPGVGAGRVLTTELSTFPSEAAFQKSGFRPWKEMQNLSKPKRRKEILAWDPSSDDLTSLV